ncbi:N(4)-acetylcytidine aminohydrolase [Pasteurella canis]|uniref:N(4)-acetylcytidine aminohydrolase n=2 Tax=Pasteurella canis TaxID=753 RepID=UPI000D916218|nr:N(4)-acetylcytidine aminohydrolase [Pasteurella canis]SPY32225.1 ASCH protein [Pasteurella canis]SPY32231.1 ASCH protein [Pasteurella canis]SPY34134.1 ASCH protein [Pasteurella canis]
MDMNKITFFTRFEQDIVAGRKTITIRDKSESYFQPNQVLAVYTNETDRFFANIKVLSVTPIHFDDLSEQHAQQENMTLPELRQVIKDIYPQDEQFWVIEFELVK